MTYTSERGRVIPPQLDDRTWQDLVDQVSALIPVYAPQWTDHNPSDPGVAIVEMFAMLVEGLIYRLNRVPDKHYIAFLNLLGVTRNPPTPALTYLTFTANAAATATVPAGTQAQTVSTELDPAIVFETDRDATIVPINLRHAVVVGPYTGTPSALTYQDRTDVIVGPPTGKFTLSLAPNEAVQMCFGFDSPTTAELALSVLLHRTLAAGQADLTLVYATGHKDPQDWPSASGTDGTDGLQHDGNLRLTAPADWEAQRPTGADGEPGWTKVGAAPGAGVLTDALYWVGLRIHNGTPAAITAGFDRFLFNSAPAHNALTIRSPELLGQSNGQPFQEFTLTNHPLHAPSGVGAAITVEVGQGTPATWEQWDVVDDLPAGPVHACRVNPVTGVVLFGNFDDTTTPGRDGHGAIPPAGAEIRARTYRYVAGGTSGNVAPDRISILSTTPAGTPPAAISAVTNLGPGFDGSDEEPIDETLRRAPDVLTTRDRAVTAEDYENLAKAATTDVVTVRCLTPRLKAAGSAWTYAGMTRAPGSVYVIVVPDNGPDDPRPEPSVNLITEVTEYLDARRDLTAAMAVVGPRYLPVNVTAQLNVWKQAISGGADEAQLKADTQARINAYLHPTRGGPDGTGWQAGQPVFASDLFRAIMPPEDIAYIASLQLSADIPAYHYPPFKPDGTDTNWDPTNERPFDLTQKAASVRVADYETVCSGTKHAITTQQTE